MKKRCSSTHKLFHTALCLLFPLCFLVGCSQQDTGDVDPRDYPLYNALYLKDLMGSCMASSTWDDPAQVRPDFLVEFFGQKTGICKLSSDAEPTIVPAKVVEEYLQLFFDLDSQDVRKSLYYLPEQNAYEVPMYSGSPAEVVITGVHQEDSLLTISYEVYLPPDRTLCRSGFTKIQLDICELYRYLSCQVVEYETAE